MIFFVKDSDYSLIKIYDGVKIIDQYPLGVLFPQWINVVMNGKIVKKLQLMDFCRPLSFVPFPKF